MLLSFTSGVPEYNSEYSAGIQPQSRRGFAMNVYAARRQELMERIGPRAVAIVGGKKQSLRNSDVEYRFRQSSDLWYLTGFCEPEALAVIAPGRAEKLTMFVRPRDPERETWTGRRAGVDGAKTKFGADQTFPVES